jgi:hypothetical protein
MHEFCFLAFFYISQLSPLTIPVCLLLRASRRGNLQTGSGRVACALPVYKFLFFLIKPDYAVTGWRRHSESSTGNI